MSATAIQVKSVEALARGLKVLQQLQREQSMSLPGLMASTSLPRTTLLRILKTLGEAGQVDRNPMNGRYFVPPDAAHPPAQVRARERLSELTAPMRRLLERRVPWPTNLAVRDGLEMVVLDTRTQCSLTPNYHALGFRPPLLFTAVGKAFLAWSPRRDVLQWIADAQRHHREGSGFDPAALQEELLQIRQQGYAVYDSARASPHTPARYGALAVPVFSQGQCVASLALVWIPQVMALEDVVARYLPPLQKASDAMSRVLTASGFPGDTA